MTAPEDEVIANVIAWSGEQHRSECVAAAQEDQARGYTATCKCDFWSRLAERTRALLPRKTHGAVAICEADSVTE